VSSDEQRRAPNYRQKGDPLLYDACQAARMAVAPSPQVLAALNARRCTAHEARRRAGDGALWTEGTNGLPKSQDPL